MLARIPPAETPAPGVLAPQMVHFQGRAERKRRQTTNSVGGPKPPVPRAQCVGNTGFGGIAKMNSIHTSCPICNRRSFLTAITSVGAALAVAPKTSAQQVQEKPTTANGSTQPYPIPWLDKNGSHNQPAGPNLEPSHIYDFKGRVARCSTFTGMGTDNKGNRIAFGSPTTDYGVMQGEYWAARTTQGGAFTHI